MKKTPTLIDNPLYKTIQFIIGAVSFLTGMVSAVVGGAFWFGKNIATVPYVDQRHEEAMKYVDKQAATTLEKAIERSDANRQGIMIEMKGYTSDIKALGAKQDILLDSIRTLQQQMYEAKRR